jgi:hypothetical protein
MHRIRVAFRQGSFTKHPHGRTHRTFPKKKVETFAGAFFHYGSRRYEQWQLRWDSPFMRSNMLA